MYTLRPLFVNIQKWVVFVTKKKEIFYTRVPKFAPLPLELKNSYTQYLKLKLKYMFMLQNFIFAVILYLSMKYLQQNLLLFLP